METSTRLDSRVMLDHIIGDYVFGIWHDGVDSWYPGKWNNTTGKYLEADQANVSLDILWPLKHQ